MKITYEDIAYDNAVSSLHKVSSMRSMDEAKIRLKFAIECMRRCSNTDIAITIANTAMATKTRRTFNKLVLKALGELNCHENSTR